MEPDEWLCAALSVNGADKAFKIVQISGERQNATVRVLHKETGAVWRFDCTVERAGAE